MDTVSSLAVAITGTGTAIAQAARVDGLGIVTLITVGGVGAIISAPSTIGRPAPPGVYYPGDRHVRREGTDYAQALLALLPQGRAWPRETDSTLYLSCNGLAGYWGWVDGRAADLLETESDARGATELLPDWERNWGLPDPCYREPITIPDRRQAVVARMTLQGGQSRDFFIGVAADLGYNITISEYAPYMCGVSLCGDTRQLTGYGYTPAVVAPFPFTPLKYNSDLEFDFTVGQGRGGAGDPAFGNFGSVDKFVTCVRASSGYVEDSAGIQRLVPPNTLRWSDKGVLIEEQRLNLVTQSLTIPYSPDPYTPDILLFPGAMIRRCSWGGAGDNNIFALGVAGWALNTTYTASIYVYIPTNPNITAVRLTIESVAPWTSGLYGQANLAIRDKWQRISGQTTSGATGTANANMVLRISSLSDADYIYVTAPQFEAGKFPTSFIGTSGAAAWRMADYVHAIVPYGQQVGAASTMFGIGTPYSPDGVGYNVLVGYDHGDITQRMQIYRNATNAVTVGITTVNSSTTSVPVGPVWTANTRRKVAFASASADQSLVVDGGIPIHTTGTWPALGLTQIAIGTSAPNNAAPWNGYIERAAFWFNSRLSNAQLQTLTTAHDDDALSDEPGIVLQPAAWPPVYSGDYRWEIGERTIRYYWTIHVYSLRLTYFHVNGSQCGVDRLLAIALATDLECVIRRWKPAHTEIVFDYSAHWGLSYTELFNTMYLAMGLP